MPGMGILDLMTQASGALHRGAAKQTGTLIRFGTEDIRDVAGNAKRMACVRVYEDPPQREKCDHTHRSKSSALKCAHTMARGEPSTNRGASWVEIRPLTPLDADPLDWGYCTSEERPKMVGGRQWTWWWISPTNVVLWKNRTEDKVCRWIPGMRAYMCVSPYPGDTLDSAARQILAEPDYMTAAEGGAL